MSKRQRAAHRAKVAHRDTRAHRRETWSGRIPDNYATVTAWAAHDDVSLETAKKRSHDTLIGLMGDLRDGGVRWLIRDGHDATHFIDHLLADRDIGLNPLGASRPELEASYRQIRRLLTTEGGYVVVAMAPARHVSP